MDQYYLAVDIGASGGRHILAHMERGRMILEEMYRFPNQMVAKDGELCWDVDWLFQEILAGMRACAGAGKVPASMGIDTWGVDFVLLDEAGGRIGNAVAYRDKRTQGMMEEVYRIIPEEELYRRTGIQKQSFNTIYQLMALKRAKGTEMERAGKFLMIPDYFNYLLTGVAANEYTVATTSQLVDPNTGQWDGELLRMLGINTNIFQKIRRPGSVLSGLRKEIQAQVGFDCNVVLVAAHDTASAVMAVPACGAVDQEGISGLQSMAGYTNIPACGAADQKGISGLQSMAGHTNIPACGAVDQEGISGLQSMAGYTNIPACGAARQEALPEGNPAGQPGTFWPDRQSAPHETDILYISSGTWSLLGTELPAADCSMGSRAHNFTNEGGYGGPFRYLKNIMGLWMIQSVKKEIGGGLGFAEICALAERERITSLVDCNAERFLSPENMTKQVQAACLESGQAVPEGIGEVASVIYRSLAACYAQATAELEGITGKHYGRIHIVGGGSNADYLNQLTADAAKRQVLAGPVEATAIGNVVAQMLADKVWDDLAKARECIFHSFPPHSFLPRM